MAAEESVATSTVGTTKEIPLEECKKHMTDTDCWLAIHGKVYDVTDFLDEHPGGYDIIIAATGKDATEDFEEIGHSEAARDMLQKHYIGELKGGAPAAPSRKTVDAYATVRKSNPTLAFLKAILPLLLIIAGVLFIISGQKA